MRYWGEISGGAKAGITMLADADGALARALGVAYDNPKAGMFGRSRRYAMLIENGVVTRFNLEQPGVCEVSTGEAMLDDL